MGTQARLERVRAAAASWRSTLGAVVLTGLVLLAGMVLSPGEAATDSAPARGDAQASGAASHSRGLLLPKEMDRMMPALTSPGSRRAALWGIQIRGLDGLAPGPQRTIPYPAWMTDSDGGQTLVRCGQSSDIDLCHPGHAGGPVEPAGVLPTKAERALEIQKATHQSIGDFDLPAGLARGQQEAIILSVAAQESGGHGFNNEMVTAGWSRGIMQITTDGYVGAGSGGCHDDDCKDCRDRVDPAACYRYYSNTAAGITRNVRDGLYALEDKHRFGYPGTWEAVDLGFGEPVTAAEMEWMFALKRYGPNYRAVQPFHYVRLIGRLLAHDLAAHYEDQPVYPELGEKLSHAYGQIISSSGPVDLRARDGQGRVTGRVGDQVAQGLPNAWYHRFVHRITALFPADALYYQVAGREDGGYGLAAVAESPIGAGWGPDGASTTAWFTVAEVPIGAGAVHEYAVDWEGGGKRATRWIDADGDGGFGDPTTIHVPEASFSVEPATPHSGRWVTLDGSGSSHADDNIVSYRWDFGDGGQTDGGPVVKHRYLAPGSYTARLTVREGHGAIDSTSRVVTVIFEATETVYLPLVGRGSR